MYSFNCSTNRNDTIFQSIGEFHPIPDQHIPGHPGSRLSYEQSVATLSSTELMRHSGEIAMKDVVFEPQEILALFASSESQSRGETLMLRDIHTMNQSIFIVVETTCPIHKASTRNASNHAGLWRSCLLLGELCKYL